MRTAEELYQYCVDNGYGQGQNKKWGQKHFALIADELQPDETVRMAFIGLHDYQSATKHDGNYAYALTDKRLILAQKKLVGQELQSVAISQISDVSTSTGLLMGTLTVNTLGTIFNVGIDKKSVRNVGDRLHSLLLELKSQSAAAPAPAASAVSAADEIKKFKELLDLGAITQEEFDAKKKQLLGL